MSALYEEQKRNVRLVAENTALEAALAQCRGLLKQQVEDVTPLRSHVAELEAANREWALTDAKTRSGWFVQTVREQQARIGELVDALRLCNIDCGELHHDKKDRHESGPCPVAARINALLDSSSGKEV